MAVINGLCKTHKGTEEPEWTQLPFAIWAPFCYLGTSIKGVTAYSFHKLEKRRHDGAICEDNACEMGSDCWTSSFLLVLLQGAVTEYLPYLCDPSHNLSKFPYMWSGS